MSLHRFFVRDAPLAAHRELELPGATARHVMVRRLQPGDPLVLFDGHGAEWPAEVRRITRSAVHVQLGAAAQPARAAELPFAVTLAFGMPANERVDTLVEKAAELGAAALQPLLTERSVLRLAGERALRRVAHWQGVAEAACEQCGRARVPPVLPVQPLSEWLAALAHEAPRAPDAAAPAAASGSRPARFVLSTAADAAPLRQARGAAGGGAAGRLLLLSGPEGGLSAAELQAAEQAGFTAVSLGPRTLRADTAPLAALAWLALDA